ncbi:MAG: SDR family oxidoreductase [Cyanobacteria bacterium J069]|nr:MAG: SDR family oxidoreductase [Cyanobacteria bacterium J069]
MFLVTGAAGGLGKRIVRQLRDQEQPVRAFVRLTSRYNELERRGAEIFIGDLTQERDIQRSLQDIQFVISAHGSNEASGGAQALDYRANIDLIDQAKAAGVQHFTLISVLGADRDYEDAPVFKAKAAVEKYLKASGLNYTILRPSGFASNLLPLAEQFRKTGVYLLVGDPRTRTSIISTDDLAKLAIASATTPAAHGQTFNVGGPEILERGEIANIFARIFKKEPILINPPLLAIDGLRAAIGFLNPGLKASLGTFRTLLANEFYTTPAEVEQLEAVYGIQLETVESFLRRYLTV